MEPKISLPNLGPERSRVNYEQSLEQPAENNAAARQYEIGTNNYERQGETLGGVVATSTVLPPPVIAPLPNVTVGADDGSDASVVADTPTLAGDEDLIEKEWVDKAKKIILQTKDDPYRREQEVSKLQAEYLQKRYGREAGTPQ